MGQDVALRQPQAGEEALIAGVGGLAGLLGLGVDHVCRVHAARAHAHHHALPVRQQRPQTELPEEGILRGHMAAGQQDHVGRSHQRRGAMRIAAVQHVHPGKAHAMIAEAPGEGQRHLVIAGMVVLPGGDGQEASAGGNMAAQVLHKAVAMKKDAGQAAARRDVIVAGAAGEVQGHGRAPPFVLPSILVPPAPVVKSGGLCYTSQDTHHTKESTHEHSFR